MQAENVLNWNLEELQFWYAPFVINCFVVLHIFCLYREGSMASAVSQQNKLETHRKKGLLQSSRQNQDEEHMEIVTGKELEEERQLISFDDDDGDDRPLENSVQPAADDTKRNEKKLLHGMSSNHTYLLDQNSEALDAIQIDNDDSDTEETPTISQQQKHGIKDNKQGKPFDFLVDIFDTHPVAASSSYGLRSQSTLPSDQKDPVGRVTRRMRASKADPMDWETTAKGGQEPDGIPAQKSKRNVQKVYGRDDE